MQGESHIKHRTREQERGGKNWDAIPALQEPECENGDEKLGCKNCGVRAAV